MDLNALINRRAQENPNSAALVFAGNIITFQQLRQRACDIRDILQQQYGVRQGDRVAWLGLNHPDMLATLLACEQCGAIFNPLNSRLVPQEYTYLLQDAEPTLCIVEREFLDRIRVEDVPEIPIVPADTLVLSSSVRSGAAADISPDQPLLLVYTSGTTGRPKGVLLSRRAVMANIENCQELYNFHPTQRVQITLPLFHVGGLCILLLPALVHGAAIYLHRRFEPDAAIREIENSRITTSIFVPAQMDSMMRHPDWPTCDLSSLQYIVVGSSIIPLHQIRIFHDRDIPVSQIYGATETGPAAIGLALDDARTHEGSAGTALKNCTIEIRAPDGSQCATGQRGEVWVRGKNILSGYWRDEDQTSKVLINGWYNTGDVGYADKSGFYWIVDRSKDVIISGGENIYPAEIEMASLQHPSITAICVVGGKHEHWGETPVAVVELADGSSLTLREYHRFLSQRLARFKHPSQLTIVESLPRNSLGKVQRAVVRERISRS